jgi:hypothetical protein
MKQRLARSLWCLAALGGAGLAVPASAEMIAGADDVDTLYVWGRRETAIGTASSASEGLVSYGAFVDRPLLRTGELAEVIPGVAVTQHSGSGKANQYFLRGFNLDHGTDFSIALNGAPLNLRTNAHGQGYLDLNLLIPELVDTIHYRKGPYFADVGDFSAAGSAAFELLDHLDESFVTLTAGEHGYGRVLGATPFGTRSYAALDVTTSDGPWERSEALRRGNFLYRVGSGDWAFTAMAYGSRWNSTDQIPRRAVDAEALSPRATLDPTDGGRSSRLLLTAQRRGEDGFVASVWAQQYRLKLFSNFTYFLDNPVDGDQFEQAEHRWSGGGTVAKTWDRDGAWTTTVGSEARYDSIGSIGLYRTRARRRLSTSREDAVRQGSAAVYGQSVWHEGPWRASAGLRYDVMGVEVNADDARNSGTAWDGILSPKATLALHASDSVEFYADVGRGYHSNDARGALTHVAPVSGDPLEPVSLLVPATGGELGVRYEREGLSASLAAWGLRLDSELVYTGDAGDTESSNASRRVGLEALLNWTPVRGVNLDLSAATTRARYRDTLPGEDRIPGALRYVLTGGVSVALTPALSGEITLRRLGPAPLIEDDTVRSGASTLTNLLVRWNFDRVSLFAEVLNVFDRRDDDITYYYASRLPGEPAAGVDDEHFHPMEPRTLRLGVKTSL